MKTTRGQAAIEFALGSLVFVTVLMFGIHFAEVGYLSAKVHEAGAAAMWDATAYRSYTFGSTYDAAGAANSAGTSAAARYADWDGRSSHNSLAPTMVLTKAQPMRINCRDDRATTSYGLVGYAPNFGETGGVSCNAEGDFGFGIGRMSSKFAEGSNGFFKASNTWKPVGSLTTLCGAGRAGGAGCAGTLSVLLGDDALNDGNQANECPLAGSGGGGCANPAFYQVTRANFDQSMNRYAGWPSGYTGRPENWARGNPFPGGIPGGEITGFYMSFRGGRAWSGTPAGGGPNTNFFEPNELAMNGGNWQSSPMDAMIGGSQPYRRAYDKRNQCGFASTSGWTGHGYCHLGKFPCGD